MSETELEPKRPSVWPWIVGLMLLAVVAWALSEVVGRQNDAVDVPVTEVDVGP